MATHSRKTPADANLLLRIEVAMRRKGWRQADLARALGVSDGAVSHWLRSRFEPDKTRLLALSKALGVSVEWLMGEQLTDEERSLERYLLELIREGGDDLLHALEGLTTEQVIAALIQAAKPSKPPRG